MVRPKNYILIDAAFIVERTHRTFFGTPLMIVEGRDHTFTFGFVRDFLRLRRKLGIKVGVLVIGKETHSLTTDGNIEDLIAILKGLRIPYVHDPLNLELQIVNRICSRFSHIITADRRFLQLCTDGRIVVLFRKSSQSEFDWMTSETVRTVMGIAPNDVPTYLALSDQSSATPLTSSQAVRVIELYGSIDSIYRNLSQVASNQIRSRLAEYESAVRQRYAACTSQRAIDPMACAVPNGSLYDLDTEKNRQLLKKYGFHSLLTLLPNPADAQPDLRNHAPTSTRYRAIVDRKGMRELESMVRRSKVCAIDTESDDKNPRQGALLGIAFAAKEGEAYFVPLIQDDLKDLTRSDVLRALRRIFDSAVDFIGHNIKYDYLLLLRTGITIRRVHFDTMLAAYECHGDWPFFNLSHLAQRLLGKEIKSYSDLVGKDSSFLELPFKEMVNHACQDADVTLRLYPILLAQLNERGITGQFLNHTMQLLKRLALYEFEGIPVNMERIDRIRQRLIRRATLLKSDICKMVGRVFDLESEQELSEILREIISFRGHIGPRRITLAILEQLGTSESVARLIVEYKRLRNRILRLESIAGAAVNGKIQPLFSQIKSRAGLMTTSEPSLFDIDGLTELKWCCHRSVRDLFADVQRALDTLARVTHDPVLLKVRTRERGVGTSIANHPLMKGLNHDELLLSVVIGQSDAKLSRRFLVERLRVATIRRELERRYQATFRWLKNFRRLAQTNGYAANGDFRKYIDGLKSSDIARREQALERAVGWLIRYY